MIPIKDAITIFEQYKIDQLRNSDFLRFESDFFTGDFSAPNYVLCKTKEWLGITGGEDRFSSFKQKRPLLSFLKKRYHRPDKEPSFDNGLPLYGKKVTYSSGIPRGSAEYEEVYKHNYYANNEAEIELDYETGECKISSSYENEQLKENPILTTLFENYNYQEIYNPSINYTVMGDIENNVIAYMDICVDNAEFKTFLESEFANSKSSNVKLLDEVLDKYADKLDEVFKLTIEKEKQLNLYCRNTIDNFKVKDLPKLPEINKEDAKTLNEFIHKNIKRQIRYNKILDKKIELAKLRKKPKKTNKE